MNFFLLEPPKPDSPEDLHGRIDVMKEEKGVNRGPAPTCPSCGRFLGMLTWLPPYRLEIETWGRHYGDIARAGDDLVVSERFTNAFERSRLKGLSCFDAIEVVKVIHRRDKPMEPVPKYFRATVTRSPTTIDQQASDYVWGNESKICPECLFDKLKRYRRLIVKQDTWNGDDVFYPRGGHGPLVSGRFKEMFEQYRLRGAIFIPSENDDAGYDSFPWET